ncbi:MAG TPA: energy transducer TonB [Opitutaceae bacterium]
MKTHPSQRKFGLPVAIVASAHAILFLGFRSPHHPPVKDHGPDIQVIGCTLRPIEDSVVEVNPGDETNDKPMSHGDPTPDLPETPSIPSDNDGMITIPAQPISFNPAVGPIHVIPPQPGTGGGGTGYLSSVGDLDFVPHALSRMAPIYPSAMKAAGISGTVTVMFTVDTSGRVTEVSVVRASRSEFEEPAKRAVSHWRFEPGKRHGRPTAFRMTIPLNFVLEN